MAKAEYVQRKFRQVVLPLFATAALASLYILISLGHWLFGDGTLVRGDLFRFCLFAVAFAVPFYGFLRLIRSVIMRSISR
jgi:hypothetical protein